MTTLLTMALCGLAAPQTFDAEAVLKRVDADRGVLQFTSGGRDRTATFGPGAKVLDADGKELADGLKAKDLAPGAAVTLTIERVDNRPVIRRVRLGKPKANADASAAAPAVVEKQDTS